VLKEPKELRGIRVRREIRVQQAILESPEPLERLDPLELKEIRVRLVMQVQ
jgi:hypothetical protein